MSSPVLISGAFDDLRSRQIRFIEEASNFGALTVLLWSDDVVRQFTGKPPKFPEAERRYFLEAIRWVQRVSVVRELPSPEVPTSAIGELAGTWVVPRSEDHPDRKAFCLEHGIGYRVIDESRWHGWPGSGPIEPGSPPRRKKVIVTGCYDWLHSGHVRFFEEVSTYGDLYVVLGNDANIRLLKGEGHPLLPADERCYVVGAVRFVTQALVATGSGWLDAQPEIQRLRPDVYAVNEDGDKGGKREYCARHGIEYLVLKRLPAPGLPPRSSTDLRGY